MIPWTARPLDIVDYRPTEPSQSLSSINDLYDHIRSSTIFDESEQNHHQDSEEDAIERERVEKERVRTLLMLQSDQFSSSENSELGSEKPITRQEESEEGGNEEYRFYMCKGCDKVRFITYTHQW